MVRDGIAWLHPRLARPEGRRGQLLLAHEIAHLLQRHAPGAGDLVAAEREADAFARAWAAGRALWMPRRRLPAHAVPLKKGSRQDAVDSPPPGKITAHPSGLLWKPKDARDELVEGVSRVEQTMAAFIRTLLDSSYTSKRFDDFWARFGSHAEKAWTGAPGAAGESETITPEFQVDGTFAWAFVRWLEVDAGVKTALTTQQREILNSALTLRAIVSAVLGKQIDTTGLPAWVDGQVVHAMASRQSSSVAKVQTEALRGITASDSFDTAGKRLMANLSSADAKSAMEKVLAPIIRDAKLMESIRSDKELTDHGIYQGLWSTSTGERKPDDPKPPIAPAGTAPDIDNVIELMLYVRSQAAEIVDPARESGGTAARRELLERYRRYLGFRSSSTADGDTRLTEGVARANAPALSSTLQAYPALEPPFNDKASDQTHTFAMQLSFTHWSEAFAGYHYEWQLIEVDEDKQKSLEELALDREAEGYRPSWGDVLAMKMEHRARYASTDLVRAISGLEITLGPPNIGVVSLVGASHVLAAIGELISTLIDIITQPRNEKKIPITDDKGGLYVVRCIATPRGADRAEAEFIRASSIAWMPVTVRTAEDMASLRLQYDLLIGEASKQRLAALDKLLAVDDALDPAVPEQADKKLPAEERAALEDEAKSLRVVLGGDLDAMLRLEKSKLEKHLGELEKSARPEDAALVDAVKDRIKDIGLILGTRKARSKDAGVDKGVLLPARFVGDKGAVMKLVLEAFEVDGATPWTYLVSDSTSPDGGDEEATAGRPELAVQRAVVTLLESGAGYGRGQLALHLPNAIVPGGRDLPLRIEASLTQIALEGLEGLTMIASIAVIAAAPFTGGSSLALLIPIGLVGAIPSAYRLIDRATSHTLRFDMAAAMDVLNIVGAALGVGQAAAGARAASVGSLLWRRTAGALMIVGIGTDGMSTLLVQAQLVMELEKVAKEVEAGNISPGEGRARVMAAMGQNLLDVGMQVGGEMVSRATMDYPAAKDWKVSDKTPKPDVDLAAPKPDVAPTAPKPDVDPAAPKPDAATTGPKADAAPHEAWLGTSGTRARASDTLHRMVKSTTGTNVPVFTDSALPSGAMHVRRRNDAHGMATDVAIVVATDAPRAKVADLPARQAKAILVLDGVSDGIRKLRAAHDAMEPGKRPVGSDAELAAMAKAVADFQEQVAAGKVEPETVVDLRDGLQDRVKAQARALGLAPEQTRVADAALAKGLPTKLRKDVPVIRVDGHPKVQGTTVRVEFDTGPFGLVTDIRVIAGPDATVKHIKDHVGTVEALRGFQGLAGLLRNIYRRLAGLPGTKTRGFEAELEKSKLHSIIEDRTKALAEGDAVSADRKAELLAEIAGYEKQLADFEKKLGSLEAGVGHVAAVDPTKTQPEAKPSPDKQPKATDEPAVTPEAGPSPDKKPAPSTPPDPATTPARDDLDGLRTRVISELGIGQSDLRVVLGGDRLAVTPKGHGKGGMAELRLPKDATIKQVLDVLVAHKTLSERRTKAIADKSWTGADEASWRGWPDPQPKDLYSWVWKDGELRTDRRTMVHDGEDVPRKAYDPETGAFVDKPDPGGNQAFSSQKIGKTDAYKELGGDEPTTPFGRWTTSVIMLGVSTRTKLIGRIPKDPGTRTHRTVRHEYVKGASGGTPTPVQGLVDAISKDTAVKKHAVFKELSSAVKKLGLTVPEADLVAFVSHQLMLRLTKGDGGLPWVFEHNGTRVEVPARAAAEQLPGLHFKEDGTYAESWYGGRHASGAETQIKVSAEDARAAGVTFTENSRDLDLSLAGPPTRQIEVKNVTEALDGKVKTQIDEQRQLLGNKVKVSRAIGGSTEVTFTKLDVVFPDPRGGLANADYMAEVIAIYPGGDVGFVVFDRFGRSQRFPPAATSTAAAPGGTTGKKDKPGAFGAQAATADKAAIAAAIVKFIEGGTP